jgi:hypothetical protein
VRDRLDPERVAEHAVCEYEGEAAHDALSNTVLGSQASVRRASHRKLGEQPQGALDRIRKTSTTARSLQLILLDRRL